MCKYRLPHNGNQCILPGEPYCVFHASALGLREPVFKPDMEFQSCKFSRSSSPKRKPETGYMVYSTLPMNGSKSLDQMARGWKSLPTIEKKRYIEMGRENNRYNVQNGKSRSIKYIAESEEEDTDEEYD